METFTDDVATRVPFALTMDVLQARLDAFQLVTEAAIKRGVRDLFTAETIVMEGAYATSFGAMRQLADDVQDTTVVVTVSGRNIDPETFDSIREEA